LEEEAMNKKAMVWNVCAACLVVSAMLAAGCPAPQARTVPDKVAASAKATMLDDFSGDLAWAVETDWADPATLETVKGMAVVQVIPGPKKKCMVSRPLTPAKDLSKHNAVLVDVTSELKDDCLVSLAMITIDGVTFVESPATTVKPGANRNTVFRLDGKGFKTAASEWKHTAAAGDLSAVSKIVLVIAPKSTGRVRIDNVRLAVLP
jgi:hypothetical protein